MKIYRVQGQMIFTLTDYGPEDETNRKLVGYDQIDDLVYAPTPTQAKTLVGQHHHNIMWGANIEHDKWEWTAEPTITELPQDQKMGHMPGTQTLFDIPAEPPKTILSADEIGF